jgi:hypothetical protein
MARSTAPKWLPEPDRTAYAGHVLIALAAHLALAAELRRLPDCRALSHEALMDRALQILQQYIAEPSAVPEPPAVREAVAAYVRASAAAGDVQRRHLAQPGPGAAH